MAIGCFEVLLSGRGYLDIAGPLEPVSLSFICAVFCFIFVHQIVPCNHFSSVMGFG